MLVGKQLNQARLALKSIPIAYACCSGGIRPPNEEVHRYETDAGPRCPQQIHQDEGASPSQQEDFPLLRCR